MRGRRRSRPPERRPASRADPENLGPPGRYRFAHALVRETLLDTLSGIRRARLHARVAAALPALHGVDALAHHHCLAVPPDVALAHSLRAADTAEKALAFERALGDREHLLAAHPALGVLAWFDEAGAP